MPKIIQIGLWVLKMWGVKRSGFVSYFGPPCTHRPSLYTHHWNAQVYLSRNWKCIRIRLSFDIFISELVVRIITAVNYATTNNEGVIPENSTLHIIYKIHEHKQQYLAQTYTLEYTMFFHVKLFSRGVHENAIDKSFRRDVCHFMCGLWPTCLRHYLSRHVEWYSPTVWMRLWLVTVSNTQYLLS